VEAELSRRLTRRKAVPSVEATGDVPTASSAELAPGRRRKRDPDIFLEYLKRRPERSPNVLVGHSAMAIARGVFLFHGVVVRGWSLGWFAGFLFAEFFLVVRLAALGDRWSGAPPLDPRTPKRWLATDLLWTLLSIVVFYGVGAKLDSVAGGWTMASSTTAIAHLRDLVIAPSWGVLVYLASFLGEFTLELVHSRTTRTSFLTSSTITAALFFGIVILGAFLIPVGFVLQLFFGEAGVRVLAALVLILARSGADIAVAWMPYWGHKVFGTEPA
jgi:hypothetical protein